MSHEDEVRGVSSGKILLEALHAALGQAHRRVESMGAMMKYPKIKYGRGRIPEAMNLQLGYFFYNNELDWVSNLWNYFQFKPRYGRNISVPGHRGGRCGTDLSTIQFFTLDMVWSQE